ncbi:galactose-1-phosphate uridylyltransferase [Bifidobacterium cuniculi]
MPPVRAVDHWVQYAVDRLDLDPRDADWMRNRLLEYAQAHPGVFEGDVLEDDAVMGLLSAPPSRVQDTFAAIEDVDGSMAAMRWFYRYGVSNGYVKQARLARNVRFEGSGLVVTINKAKPEFADTHAAALANSVDGSYAQCTICHANEGLASRGKRTLRTVPVTLGGEAWFWQFSPYGYFREHGICVNRTHVPMHVDRMAFVRLLDFVDRFPGYFLGCNAALPRIGGSILSHDHYQGGGGILPMQRAVALHALRVPDAVVETLDWPASAVRVVSRSREAVVDTCERIRAAWTAYADPALGVEPVGPDGEPQSSLAPSARITERGYEMNIVLRNNAVSETYPLGVFHAHPEYFFVKREGIGLIEAQGLFILPARLERQLGQLEDVLAAGGPLSRELSAFALAAEEVRDAMGGNGGPGPAEADRARVRALVRDEIASICRRILGNIAVFPDEPALYDFLVGALR